MRSKPKFYQKIWSSIRPKAGAGSGFLEELAKGLNYRRLKEYPPRIPFSLTDTNFDRLEKPVLLFAISISQLALKVESNVSCAFEGLNNEDLGALRQILRQNYSEAEW